MSEQEPIIQVERLIKRFGDQTVLDGINLEVYPGETMVIMGGSGCGKSTLQPEPPMITMVSPG